MTAGVLVIVVAPDKDFRRSLEFSLESEGFAVESHASISKALASPRAEEADCAVIDDAAVEDWRMVAQDFLHFGKPVVLLQGRIQAVPSLPLTIVLTKPFLGNPLIEAIRGISIGGGRSQATCFPLRT
ncbi:hypothetical protein [Mesorhizobium sp. YR577]|uniref:hypothetical protein n=1 Tax=Mesorhizobium sp. YR577 TaxID=1884373 RepID=UPI0011149D6B|nr:hypothetical protein [Mesorhizobium sp. YR577]